jgi:type I restriction enzyme S subunit
MTTVKMVKLGTLIKPAKLQKCGNDDYPVLSMTMHNGLVFQSDKFKKSVASQDKSTYKVVHRNQLVIGFPIDEGVLATQRITDVGIVSPAYGIWDVDQTKIIPEFLEYALRCNRAIDYYKAKLRGSTARRRSLPTPTLLELDVPLPDIEQQRLALTTIHHAKNALDSRQAQLTKLDELVKARFVEMFGDPISNTKRWDVIELGSLTGIGSSKRIFEKEYVSEGIPFYRTKEIVELSKGNPISTELYITEKRFLEIKEQYGVPQKGDLLISAVGTIGVIWIVDEKNDFYFKDGNLIRVDSSDRFNSTYMKTLLESLIAEYKKQMSSGTAYSALTISGLMKMKIYDVPLSLQNQFADFVAKVDKSKADVQKALDQTQLLFDSLMQQYFG